MAIDALHGVKAVETAFHEPSLRKLLLQLVRKLQPSMMTEEEFERTLNLAFYRNCYLKRPGVRGNDLEEFARFKSRVQGKPRDMQMLLAHVENYLWDLMVGAIITINQFQRLVGQRTVEAFAKDHDVIIDFHTYVQGLDLSVFYSRTDRSWPVLLNMALEKDGRERAALAAEFLRIHTLVDSFYRTNGNVQRPEIPEFPEDTSLRSLESSLIRIRKVANELKTKEVQGENTKRELEWYIGHLFPEEVLERRKEEIRNRVHAILG